MAVAQWEQRHTCRFFVEVVPVSFIYRTSVGSLCLPLTTMLLSPDYFFWTSHVFAGIFFTRGRLVQGIPCPVCISKYSCAKFSDGNKG
jgi:hypothetical protein